MAEVKNQVAAMPNDDKEKKKNKRKDRLLPYCTTAPSAEHHRADSDDEPCDDGR